jgi:hypothetical protein
MAVARREDPWTSWAAAGSVEEITRKQRAVLAVLRFKGPLTDAELREAYRKASNLPWQEDSGLRTRRRELVDKGLVENTGVTRPLEKTGRQAIVWAAR